MQTSASVATDLHFHYVLVIEFLSMDEHRTGTILASRLEKSLRNLTLRFESCSTSDDVLKVIARAVSDIPTLGYPIVHFEAHGIKRSDQSNVGGIGYKQPGGRTVGLSWNSLWDALRELNIATDFNLLVITAACFSDDIFYGLAEGGNLEAIRSAPFMATVGFDTTVHPSRLLEAMTTLYTCLLDGDSLSNAVNIANIQLDEPELLVERWSVFMLRSVLEKFLFNADESNAEYYWARYLRENPNGTLSKEELIRGISGYEQPALEMVMARFLAYDTHPHNQKRFSFLQF